LFRKACSLWDNVEKCGRVEQASDDGIMLHAEDTLCMPDNWSKNTYTHTQNM